MLAYAKDGKIMDVAAFMDPAKLKDEFPTTIGLTSEGDKIWSIPTKADVKSMIWYPVKAFAAKGYAVPKTWDEFIEVCKKLQKPPKLTGFGMCLGLYTDADNNIINMIWNYGGKLIEADDKTIALHSPGTVQAVKVIADM